MDRNARKLASHREDGSEVGSEVGSNTDSDSEEKVCVQYKICIYFKPLKQCFSNVIVLF